MIALRKTVKYTLVAVYVVFCPLLICHALGIMIKPKEKTIMQATGLISVKTTPSFATVYLNGVLKPNKTPLIIGNLPEGDYELRVERVGYRAWDKTVRVRKNYATAHEQIVLIPVDVVPQPIMGIPAGTRLITTSAQHALVAKDRTVGGIARLTLHESDATPSLRAQITPLLSPQATSAKREAHEVIAIPGTDIVIVRTHTEDGSRYLMLNASETATEATDVTALCAGKPSIFITDPRQPGSTLLYDGKPSRVFLLAGKTPVYLTDDGKLLADKMQAPLVDGGIRGIIEDHDRKAVVYWTADEIGMIALARSGDRSGSKESVKRVRVITGGRDITSVTEADRGSHLVYIDGDRVMFAEADIRAPRTVELTTTSGPAIYLDRHGRLLLTRADASIASVTVVPERNIFNLALPVFDEEERHE